MIPCPKCRHPMHPVTIVVKNISERVLVCVRCNHREK